MKPAWLAIDTAGDVASVVVSHPREGSREIGASDVVRGARQQASRLLVVIDATLKLAGTTLDDLAGIVLGDGPGSFTGLRIGWAAAKGLAHEAGLELRAIPSLLAAAAGAALKLGPQPVAACFDALRGQVYGALYVLHPQRVETLVPPAVLTIAELARLAPVRPRVAVGDGAVRYAGEIVKWTGADPIPPESLPPVASLLLSLLEHEGAARLVADPDTAEPVYGRPAEAQAKWEMRHGRPL